MKLSPVFATALSTFAVSAITALGFSGQAQGLTFLGSSSGIWGQPNPGSNNTDPVYSGVGTNTFSWGRARPDDFVNNYGTPPNDLIFTGNSFSVEDIGSPFKVGSLEYFNGKVELGTNVNSVPLNLSLLFTNPGNLNEVFNFDFQLDNTTNSGEDPDEDADTVFVKGNFGDRTFKLDDGEYLLNIIGFIPDDGSTSVSQFRVLEGARATAGLYARITRVTPPRKVPEPASVIGLSVLGIYLVYRKKSISSKKIE